MSVAMKEVLQELDMVNVMGDCYCDDWALMEAIDGLNDEIQKEEVRPIVELMHRQVRPGSIAIFHMPEKNFRKAAIWALDGFLEMCQRRNLKCVTLSTLQEICTHS
jgi:hypothetical protein